MKNIITFIIFLSYINCGFSQKYTIESGEVEFILSSTIDSNMEDARSRLSDEEYVLFRKRIVTEVLDSIRTKNNVLLKQKHEYISFLNESSYRIDNISQPISNINLIITPSFITHWRTRSTYARCDGKSYATHSGVNYATRAGMKSGSKSDS